MVINSALRRITHHLDKSPDTLTTDDLKRYFAQLIKTYSWDTVRIDRNGLRKLWLSYVFLLMHLLNEAAARQSKADSD